jgi:hypothetical protein
MAFTPFWLDFQRELHRLVHPLGVEGKLFLLFYLAFYLAFYLPFPFAGR